MEPSPSRSIELRGKPVEIRYARGLRDAAGNEAHAATFIRQRRIVLDRALKRNPAEHTRILAHELFHFAWVRLGNARRFSWENLLRGEWRAGIRGEAGWSAEWRKLVLNTRDLETRTRRWREYCCEAFCDTGAFTEAGRSDEVTLRGPALQQRIRWFESNLQSVAHI